MYASHVEVQLQSGKTAEAIQRTKDLIPKIGEIPKIKRFMVLDKGDDNFLFIAFYDTAAEQEAAGALAKELLGRLEHFYAAPPERIQVEVPINHSYEQGEAIAL